MSSWRIISRNTHVRSNLSRCSSSRNPPRGCFLQSNPYVRYSISPVKQDDYSLIKFIPSPNTLWGRMLMVFSWITLIIYRWLHLLINLLSRGTTIIPVKTSLPCRAHQITATDVETSPPLWFSMVRVKPTSFLPSEYPLQIFPITHSAQKCFLWAVREILWISLIVLAHDGNRAPSHKLQGSEYFL